MSEDEIEVELDDVPQSVQDELSTVKLDPVEISEDVQNELEEHLDNEEAEKLAKQVRVNESIHKNPRKKPLRSQILTSLSVVKNKSYNVFKSLSNISFKTSYSPYGTIKDTTICDEKIIIEFIYQEETYKLETEPDGTFLSNLLSYYSVTKIEELKGKPIVFLKSGQLSNFINPFDTTGVSIPSNVAFHGKIRYKIWKNLIVAHHKLPLNTKLYHLLFTAFFLFWIGVIITSLTVSFASGSSSLLIQLAGIIPLVISLTATISLIAYLSINSLIIILTRLFKANYTRSVSQG